MSDDDQGGTFNWGGLVKGILAGVAIVAGVEMIAPGTVSGIIGAFGSSGGPAAGESLKGIIEGIAPVVRWIAGAAMVATGISAMLGDHSSDNADRHAQAHSEARESFAVREDMRKMQAVMMARMKAAGHEPALAVSAPGR
jgi:hypothetical protein